MTVIKPLVPEHHRLGEAAVTLNRVGAEERVRWALENLPERQVLASSFGAQSAVMLHLVTRFRPDIPVIFIDTGYHFPETYRFVDEMTERLDLNLHVYSARHSAAWQEARHGRRWEQGQAGLDAYNRENKVEPMQRALRELDARTWFSGIRRAQADTRRHIRLSESRNGRIKFHPLFDWSDRDVHDYLVRHGLPYHPLWHEGYVSIGDWHTTRSLADVDHPDETRFFGLKRECGLHESV